MIDRRLIQNLDWTLIALLLINSFIGLAFIYSASFGLAGGFFLKQLIFIFVGLSALFICLMVDYRYYTVYSPVLYGLFLVILAGVLFFGKWIAGTKSWTEIQNMHIDDLEFFAKTINRLERNLKEKPIENEEGLRKAVKEAEKAVSGEEKKK